MLPFLPLEVRLFLLEYRGTDESFLWPEGMNSTAGACGFGLCSLFFGACAGNYYKRVVCGFVSFDGRQSRSRDVISRLPTDTREGHMEQRVLLPFGFASLQYLRIPNCSNYLRVPSCGCKFKSH